MTYNINTIKGCEIEEIISKSDKNYQVINDRINSFYLKAKLQKDNTSINLTMAIFIYFFIFNIIMPAAFRTSSWYETAITFPRGMGLFSLWTIINFIITVFVLVKYGYVFVKRACLTYWNKKEINMETLISIGSMGALALFIFFLVDFSTTYKHLSTKTVSQMANIIITLNSSLTASAIIIVVISVGQYF